MEYFLILKLNPSQPWSVGKDFENMISTCIIWYYYFRPGRETLRAKNTYLILRELHSVEKDREVLLATENIVDILIKKEEEIGLENYKEVEVPEDLVPQLQKMDESYLKD